MILSPVKTKLDGRNGKETSHFSKKEIRTRKDILKSETSIWKARKKPPKGHN